MEHINKFFKGLNKDLSLDLITPEYYFDAHNMTLITQNGKSTGAIQNTKGNLLSIIPEDTSNVLEFVLDPTLAGTISINIVLTPSGTIINFVVPFTTSEQDFYEAVSDYINTNHNQDGVYAAFNSDHVVLWSGLGVGNELLNTDLLGSGSILTGTGTLTVNNTYVPAQVDLQWIGWGRIRDDFYLFSTNETTDASPTTSYGQIWKFQYDKLTQYYRLTLMYNNQINFTNYHPIPNPGGFVGNYETDTIQKIYWTDNYNRLRSINTEDPDLFALEPDNIDVYPNIALSIPILQNIGTGGVLNKGIWHCAYRLKKDTGSSTTFSQCSNPVFLVGAAENVEMIFFQTDDPFVGNSGKTLTFQINNVDTSYDRIEVLALYRTVDGGIPRVMLIVEEPILTDTFQCTFTGNQPVVDIPLEEYLQDPLVFDTIKSIVSKNNFLFAGNVKYSDFDVDFDARAFRYNRSGLGATTYEDPTGNPNDINPNQDPGMVGDPNTAYLYQSDGVTIGGEGLNGLVSYEFTRPDFTTPSNGDQSIVLDNSYTGTVNPTAPFFEIFPNSNNQIIDLGTDFQQYPNPYTYPDYHSPYVANSIRQYRRDELYRFGIVFFSKKGEPSYVHWIADIRMPHAYMPDQTQALVTRVPLAPNYENYYPLTCGQSSIIYGNPLGVKFTVNVDSIKDQISGYSIVRVKRENADKSVLGQGILYPAHTVGTDDYIINSNLTGVYLTGAISIEPVTGQGMSSFNSPDFLFRGSPRQLNGDHFDYIGLLTKYCESTSTWCTGINVGNFKVIKYQHNDSFSGIRQIEFTGATLALYQPLILSSAAVDLARAYEELDPGGGGNVNMRPYFSGGTLPTLDVYNGSIETAAAANIVPTLGSKSLLAYCEFSDGSGAGNTAYQNNVAGDDVMASTVVPVDNQYLVNYKRTLTQYGGNTNAQKSKNEYISTGHYQPVDDTYTGSTAGTFTYTGTVFGGDSYICMFDNVKQFPRPNIGLDWDSSSQTTGECVHIYPVETDININLRYSTGGAIANKYQAVIMFDPPNYDSIDVFEQFLLRPFVDMENDIRLYFPRPIPFVDTTQHDVRVFASQRKVNGEIIDSWGQFKEDDYIDLDSIQGPLNNLIVHKDKLIGYQDQGIVSLPVEERSLIQDNTGADLTLGTGGVLPRYDYISKKIGSKHQFGFTQSPDAIFFFDINSRSLYRQVDTNPENISLMEGISSYLKENLIGLIQTHDNPFRAEGITATYDFNDNEAIFTFRDKQKNLSTPYPVSITFGPNLNNMFEIQFAVDPGLAVGDEVVYDYIDPFSGVPISLLCTVLAINPGFKYMIQPEGIVNFVGLPGQGTAYTLSLVPFTIAFNDFIQGFTSFYDFFPCMYINDQLNYFSPSPTQDDMWIHKKGPHGSYYQPTIGGIPSASTVSMIINPQYKSTKRFNSYSMITEVTNANLEEQLQETFSTIRLYNNNQNTDVQVIPIDPVTGSINLSTGTISPRGSKQIAKRVEEQWNLSYLFDRVMYTTPNPDIFTDLSTPNDIQFAQRMRSKYVICDLSYDNANDYNIILRSFSTNFDISP